MSDPIRALAEGQLSGAALLGLSDADIDALVEQALGQAAHGQVDAACAAMARLSAAAPTRPVLSLVLGHLEAERGDTSAARDAYAEAARRLEVSGLDLPSLRGDIELARAELALALGETEEADRRLRTVVDIGSQQSRMRAETLLRSRGA